MTIFISYCHEDSKIVQDRLLDHLRTFTSDVWWRDDIPIQAHERKNPTVIANCDIVIVVLSTHSIKSSACRIEWEYALRLEKLIIPVFIESVERPPDIPPYKSFNLSSSPDKQITELILHIQWALRSNERRQKLLSIVSTFEEPKQLAPKPLVWRKMKRVRDRQIGEGEEQPRSIHIMSSAKGDVGKTSLLFALRSYFNRRFKPNSTLVVDMCHYAQDAFNWLSNPEYIYKSPQNWLCTGTRDIASGRIMGQEKTKKYENFWKQLQDVIDFRPYRRRDLLVDTNLDISNLCPDPLGDQKESSICRQIIEHKNIQLHIWFIWSRRSLLNSQDFAESIEQFYQMVGQSNRSRIKFIHVLNPYAIDTVQEIWRRVTTSVYHSEHRETQDKLRTALARLDYRRRKDTANVMLNTIDSEFDSLLSRLDNWQPESYTYESLKKLLYEEPVTGETITIPKLQSYIASYLSLEPDIRCTESFFDVMYETAFHGKGRPYNLFPIPTYNFRQIEQTIDPRVGKLGESNDELERDVTKFLDDFNHVKALSSYSA